MLKIYTTVLMLFFAFTPGVQAGEFLTGDQAKALFMDKTFDGSYTKKGKKKVFWAYEAPDGGHHVLRPNGKTDKGRQWSVEDDGKHCTTSKKWDGPRCSRVKDVGGGEYHKVDDKGKHTHTLTNFRDGNQLKSVSLN